MVLVSRVGQFMKNSWNGIEDNGCLIHDTQFDHIFVLVKAMMAIIDKRSFLISCKSMRICPPFSLRYMLRPKLERRQS
jgi:hypothetical protein